LPLGHNGCAAEAAMEVAEAGGRDQPLLPPAERSTDSVGEASPPLSKTPKSPKDLRRQISLPDLTDRIAKLGLMKEYQRFRQGYLNWRQGWHQGARGEATHSGFEAERVRMQFLEPSEEEFKWRKTISYWIVTCTLEGSFIFIFTSLNSCYPDFWGRLVEAVTTRSTFVGGSFFYLSTYMVCFEVMNLKCEHDEIRWNPFNIPRHLKHCEDIGLRTWPFLAGVLYFIGANFFQVNLTISLFPALIARPMLNFYGVQIPCAVGGVFFFLASLCEVKEWLAEKQQTVLFAVINNLLGGALFAAGGIIYMVKETPHFDPVWVGGMVYVVGSINYVLGAVSSLMIWRDGNFGLTYSAQLGKLAPHESLGRFSAFSIALVTGLCLFGTVAVLVFFCEADLNWLNAHDEADYTTRTFYPFLLFVIIHMVIALRAAVVNLPTEQPWRALHRGCHLLLAMASAILLAQFADCVWQVHEA